MGPWELGVKNMLAGKNKEAGTANCNLNAKNILNFLLKMQREWRITPEK